MPYTLMKALLWLVLALIIGFFVGWALRSLIAQRQVVRARSQRVDTAEVERLRGRVANLESVVAERDRLAAEVESLRSAAGPPPAAARATVAPAPIDTAVPPERDRDGAGGDGPGAGVEVGTSGEPPTTPTSPEPAPSEAAGAPADGAPDDDAGSVPSTPDVAAAATVLGHRIELDDLKVIEGIGPKIEELCHGIGIRTWVDLAGTEVSLLRTMLTDAGARYKMHDPTTWPRQAELLATGRWHEFVEFTAALERGKAPRG